MTAKVNTIINGDCIEEMEKIETNSIDLIFADPPYNLQLKNDLYRPNQTKVNGVFDNWDKFESMQKYDDFSEKWLRQCKRILKDDATIWLIGSYHNIFRLGVILQNLGFWILNDIIWIKTNPMPNFMGTRFNNAHETLIWASKNKNSKFTFHYKAMKCFNDDLQMRSDWYIPICNGQERLKTNGQKAHSTQKPEELLFRIILASSNAGDLILDPFSGTGTTASVAKKLGRNYIGIEKESSYISISNERLQNITPIEKSLLEYQIEKPIPKVPFGNLIEKNIILIGDFLFSKDKKFKAQVLSDASIVCNNEAGSIHKVSAKIQGKSNNNGWTFWSIERDNQLVTIDSLRQEYANKYLNKF